MRHIVILISALLIFACDEDKSFVPDACTSADPIEDVQWIQELKNSLTDCGCEKSIIQGKYLSETVFYVAFTDPQCLAVLTPTTLYDCNGMVFRKFSLTDKDQNDLKKLRRVEILYSCND